MPSNSHPSLASISTSGGLARTMLLALSFCAILVGLLAFHSSTGSHAFAGVPLTHQTQTTSVAATTSVDAAPTAPPSVTCDTECLMGAIALLACLSLLVLMAIAYFFRVPTSQAQPRDRGPTATSAIRGPHFSLPQPSLTALCVIQV